ncbi:SAC3/GANP/Nin1/mts3/eIF-3 p25 family-domain-containing protein [Lobosporangium transversale]|uniref:SAC3/GANP/Nin1/mts3/eIF-3 p25 family-domain-containing protein n=1 Tax=Lobosporangium transversale TaxID=64571 RepID=A0A1Y2G9B6_9FUNG|nr:SAC3/GANP/Nin1/mts3/eIF-3 p25 family-domain-containing protein [Lobosporangium transversale]ORZ00053.1 SAC3/GANP/Nin1/mts3/eIF-3 p25 family-domain-containing protein [Lobosporangium transversale]|eukprot:XP_021876094.1 SAC3/GANP/Nin1/mts3/eIF-3 p25 family-domain-containing protein [Lobosporangium transversale]
MALTDIKTLAQELSKEYNAPNPDLAKCGQYLSKLKIALIELQYLTHEGKHNNIEELTLARDVLEIGAQWSVRTKDIPSFERYMAQLQTYYNDYSELPTSPLKYNLIGLNLLCLLSQNRISDFHTALETIESQELLNNPAIQHPIKLEQSLMEGSYNRVWSSRADVPSKEYLFFIDILMDTIRNEIASCSEKAYSSLPLKDAGTLLFFTNMEDILNFAKERNWKVNPVEQKAYFHSDADERISIPANQIIKQTMFYARDMDRIV